MPTTLNDYLSDKKLWASIQAVKKFPFLEGNLTLVMESSLKVLFGQRIMFEPMSKLPIEEVAQQLVMLYGEKWIALTTSMDDVNLAGDYIVRKKGNKDSTGSKETDTLTEHQTIAYNEDTLSTESADKFGGVENDKSNVKSSEDVEKISYTSYFKNLQSAQQLAIMESILRDSARLLTINVY